MFIDSLIDAIKEKNNPSVAGLDTRIEHVPDFIKKPLFDKYGHTMQAAAEAITTFNKFIIDAAYDIVPAVKPQVAYYEMYGTHGMQSFYDTVEYARSKGLLIIADCKRNDIDSTAESYSRAYIGEVDIEGTTHRAFNADCVTVTPYLGDDGIAPFVKDCKEYGKGIFVLVKTSNKSSGQFQDLTLANGKKLYEEVAEYVESLALETAGSYGYGEVGAVVGATYPQEAVVLRQIMKHAFFLVPGYGQQGGSAKDIAGCFNKDGLGALINASRSIMLAYRNERWKDKYKEEEFYKASREAAIAMRDDIVSILK